MPLEKISDAEYLIHEIDEMIRELKLRRANIMAMLPQKKPAKLLTHIELPNGKRIKIKGR